MRQIPAMPQSIRFLYSIGLFIILFTITGCATQKTVRFKINSVPKGAHVLYQVKGGNSPCQGQWLYLGNTPLQSVRQLAENEVEDADKITLRIIHNGYHEQTKEWDGIGFWEEIEERDMIFWTPELIPNLREQ